MQPQHFTRREGAQQAQTSSLTRRDSGGDRIRWELAEITAPVEKICAETGKPGTGPGIDDRRRVHYL
jgi:hypothetical protein